MGSPSALTLLTEDGFAVSNKAQLQERYQRYQLHQFMQELTASYLYEIQDVSDMQLDARGPWQSLPARLAALQGPE